MGKTEDHTEIKKGMKMVREENAKNVNLNRQNMSNQQMFVNPNAGVIKGFPIEPTGNKIYVKILTEEEKDSKLILSEELEQEKNPYLQIIGIGPDVRGDFKVGDFILVGAQFRILTAPIFNVKFGEVYESMILGKVIDTSKLK